MGPTTAGFTANALKLAYFRAIELELEATWNH